MTWCTYMPQDQNSFEIYHKDKQKHNRIKYFDAKKKQFRMSQQKILDLNPRKQSENRRHPGSDPGLRLPLLSSSVT